MSAVYADEFYANFNNAERKLLKMRAFGYNNGEIAREFKKPVNVVANEVGRLYFTAKEYLAV